MKILSKLKTFGQRESVQAYLFLLPWLVGFSIFAIGAIATIVYFGFFKYDLTQAVYVGVGNYVHLFFEDELFWKSLRVTLTYAGGVIPLQLGIGLFLALLLNQKLRGILTFRALFYLPAVVSGAAASLIFMWMYHPSMGLINYCLSFLGIAGPGWLTSERWALPALVLISTWYVGGIMLIFLAGLQNIPTVLYEVATIDGGGTFRKFISITLPILSPVILFNLVISTIGAFQVFTQAYIMTQGGPHYATMFYALSIYRNALLFGKFGKASSMAVILVGLILGVTGIIMKTSRKWVFYRQ